MSRAFTTTLEAVSSNKTKTTIKLSMSNTAARQFARHYLNSIDKELMVSFDDPQMEMEIQKNSNGPGLVATVDGSGVVESVKGEDTGDQEEMDLGDDGFADVGFDQDGESEAPEESEEEAGGADPEEETEEETDFDAAEDMVNEVVPVDKEELEQFILEERPAFMDIPFNFPELIERKREGETWMAIAKDLQVRSTQLQTAYTKYKKMAAKKYVEKHGA